MKVRLDIFDSYEAKLLELNTLHGRLTLDLEFKDEEGKFAEEYDSNWLYLRVVKHEEGLNYDWSKSDSFPSINIRVNPKQETVRQLEEKVAEALDIPFENLIIFLRNEHGYNSSVSPEYYNLEWRRNKIIKEVSKTLTHGKVLFCEFVVHGERISSYNWHQEFTSEAERITISVNDAVNDPEASDFNIKISMKKSDPVRKLKEQVGLRFNLEMD